LNPQAEAILDFWFGVNSASDSVDARNRRWFAVSESMDRDIEQRFGDMLDNAIAGQLDHWRDTSRGTLALIILLDQFSRNIFRGTARAFAQDDMALRLATEAIANGLDRDMDEIECGFLYMPFQHAEDRNVQDRSVALYHELNARAREAFRKATANFCRYAEEHRAIVAEFDRFPHRNAILGREATPEEEAFLTSDERTYGQRAEQN
jgi:uncharacterized protein (DUF924 family)